MELNEEEKVFQADKNSEIQADLLKKRRLIFQRLKKEATWRAIIAEAHKNNDLTREEWCRKNHIASRTFTYWEKYFIQKGEIKTNMTENHKQYKKHLWKQRILDVYTSNLTVKDWCNQNNISATYFYDWKIALERSGDIPKHLRKSHKKHLKDWLKREATWKAIIAEAHKNNDLTREE